MAEIISTISGTLWGLPMLLSIAACGILFTFGTKFFAFRHFGHICKNTIGSLSKSDGKSKTGVSPFEAACIAIGGAVGVGNITGVASAIAMGGPGAVFWMWLWGIFGMTVKMVESSVGCYYRCKNSEGEYFGGPSYYMSRGIAEEQGKKIGLILAALFGISFLFHSVSGLSVFNISDALYATLNIPRLITAGAFSLFLLYIIWKGVPRISRFSVKAVPFMCMLYLLAGIVIIIMHIQNVPVVFAQIFHDAFTGTAATGGFVGVGVMTVVKTGVARAINSNEAGQGSSPMIHASADTVHPIRQGLWGCMEVFVDTIIVCSVTALSILVSGVWNTGLKGAALGVEAFRVSFGHAGVIFIAVLVFLFGLTTSAGWFAYYQAILNYLFGKKPSVYKALLTFWKVLYPAASFGIVLIFVVSNADLDTYWNFMDIVTVLPVFFNVIALFFLTNTFFKLFKDYKARYLGEGEVDPDMDVFYDDKLAKEKNTSVE